MDLFFTLSYPLRSLLTPNSSFLILFPLYLNAAPLFYVMRENQLNQRIIKIFSKLCPFLVLHCVYKYEDTKSSKKEEDCDDRRKFA